MAGEVGDGQRALIDLRDIDLGVLAELPATVLYGALREILSDDEDDRYCGFQSALP